MKSKRKHTNNNNSSSNNNMNHQKKNPFTIFFLSLGLFIFCSFLSHLKKQGYQPIEGFPTSSSNEMNLNNEKHHGNSYYDDSNYDDDDDDDDDASFEYEQRNDIISIEETHEVVSSSNENQGHDDYNNDIITNSNVISISSKNNNNNIDTEDPEKVFNVLRRRCIPKPNSNELLCTEFKSERKRAFEIQNQHGNDPNAMTTINIPKEILDKNPNGGIHIQFRRDDGNVNTIKINGNIDPTKNNNLDQFIQVHSTDPSKMIDDGSNSGGSSVVGGGPGMNGIRISINSEPNEKLKQLTSEDTPPIKIATTSNTQTISTTTSTTTATTTSTVVSTSSTVLNSGASVTSTTTMISENEDDDGTNDHDVNTNRNNSNNNDMNKTGQGTLKAPFQVIKYDQISVYENTDTRNQNPNFTLIRPRYFLQMTNKTRSSDELSYFNSNGNRWSQRVVLEMLFYQILGVMIHDPMEIHEILKKQTALDNDGNNNNDSNGGRGSSNSSSDGHDGDVDDNLTETNDHLNNEKRARTVLLGIFNHPKTTEAIAFKKEFRLNGWTDISLDVCDWEGIYCHSRSFKNDNAIVDDDDDDDDDDLTEDCECGVEDDNESDYEKRRNSTTYQNEDVKIEIDYVGSNCFCVDPKIPKLSQYYKNWDTENELKQQVVQNLDQNGCECKDDSILTMTPPKGAITEIILDKDNYIGGSLPKDLGSLPFLKRLVIKRGVFIGRLPFDFADFTNLNELHLEGLDLMGAIPSKIGLLNRTLENLTLRNCKLDGTIPKSVMKLTKLKQLDLSGNKLKEAIPKNIAKLKELEVLDLSHNQLTGTVASLLGDLTNLRLLNLAGNTLQGSLPKELNKLTSLVSVDVESNWFMGAFKNNFDMFKDLKILKLGQNKFSGNLPTGGWDGMEKIDFHGNMISGAIPQDIISPTLRELNLAQNSLIGTIPELHKAKNLTALLLQENLLHGNVSILEPLAKDVEVHLEKNKFVGVLDERRCVGLKARNYTVPFNCTDFIACQAGTFHPEGAANDISGCIRCPTCPPHSDSTHCEMIGQSDCDGASIDFVRGDMNGDGILSQREVLRLFFTLTGGHDWGEQYSDWGDLNTNECALSGINCKGGKVTKIDLRGATLCSGPPCGGIPSEIGLLGDSLEILDLSGSYSRLFHLEIPSTIGRLSKLKVFDVSQNSVKTIPNEIGLMSSLQVLNLKQCRYYGFFPETLWDLTNLEKINLNDNSFSGVQFPSEFGKLTNLRELLLSRANIKGTIPSELGYLTHLKNLEFYGNGLEGTIPSSFGNFTNLRRIDLFSNSLEGPIDFISKIPFFEVIHLRTNKFTGTIPRDIGKLKKLSWLDVAENKLTGTIPSSLSNIPALKDLFLGQNYLHDPIPSSLCSKSGVNGGQDEIGSCEHILCPIGKYSKQGFANLSKGSKCLPCNENETSLHLGMSSCKKMSRFDYLTMIEALVNGKEWHHDMHDDEGIAKKDECKLDSVTCDREGNIVGLDLPLSGIDFKSLP